MIPFRSVEFRQQFYSLPGRVGKKIIFWNTSKYRDEGKKMTKLDELFFPRRWTNYRRDRVF